MFALVSQANANNDDFFNWGDAQYNIYNDNRRYSQHRTTVVKKYYNKTIIKEVPVGPPVQQVIIPRVVPVQVGRNVGNMAPPPPPIPPTPGIICQVARTGVILDQFGNVVDYQYTQVCR